MLQKIGNMLNDIQKREFTMLELVPRRISRINSKARSEGNILGGSTLLIERFANPGWHHRGGKEVISKLMMSTRIGKTFY